MDPLNVLQYETLAQARLDPSAWAFYSSGADGEVTLRANRAAFERLQVLPRMLRGVRQADLRTTVLGTPVRFPVLVAPTARQGLACSEGECATAWATGALGTLMTASTESTRSLEEIALAATGPLWFQLYLRLSQLKPGRFLVAYQLCFGPSREARLLLGIAKTFGQMRSGTRNTSRDAQRAEAQRVTMNGAVLCHRCGRKSRGSKGIDWVRSPMTRHPAVTVLISSLTPHPGGECSSRCPFFPVD